jgi:hypothetical protein
LLNRHSRELAYALSEVYVNNPHLTFWSQPDIAAKAWLAYNKRMLKFAKAHPHRVLLFTQRAFFEGAPLIETINERFGFSLNSEAESPFDSSLFNDNACLSIKENLSHSLKRQLDNVWKELVDIADFRSANEEPIFYSISDSYHKYYDNYQIAMQKLSLPTDKSQALAPEQSLDVIMFQTFSEQACVNCLIDMRSQICDEQVLNHVQQYLSEKFNTSGKVQLEFARLLQVSKRYANAIHVYHKCIALGIMFTYVNMLLGQC